MFIWGSWMGVQLTQVNLKNGCLSGSLYVAELPLTDYVWHFCQRGVFCFVCKISDLTDSRKVCILLTYGRACTFFVGEAVSLLVQHILRSAAWRVPAGKQQLQWRSTSVTLGRRCFQCVCRCPSTEGSAADTGDGWIEETWDSGS